ncbi:MAG: hypothetical protein HOE90_00610 [Bacteriovoracaceae bacterium]|nr:hypothetical protein [Bacteriovoracaceae bacterium]
MNGIFAVILFLFCTRVGADSNSSHIPIVGVVDLHAHFAAHKLGYGYGAGALQKIKNPTSLTHKHRFKQTMFEPYLAKSGLKIIVATALGNVFKMGFPGYNPKKDIEKQIKYLEGFVAKFPQKYAIALSSGEAREAISSGRIVFVHAIEGATKLIKSVDDIYHWKKRGVRMMGPIHMKDNKIGGSYLSNRVYRFFNINGRIRKLLGKNRGLKDFGKKVVNAMVNSGMMVDLSHMGEDSRADTLKILKRHKIPPIVTHGYTKEVLDDPRNFSNDEINEIYDLGGLFGIGGDIKSLSKVSKKYKKSLDYCPKTIDSFLFQYEHINSLYANEPRPIAFGSDFNGGINHFKPKYGKHGCSEKSRVVNIDDFNTSGLRHVGMMKGFIKELGNRSNSLSLQSSAEGFLNAWEKVEKFSENL